MSRSTTTRFFSSFQAPGFHGPQIGFEPQEGEDRINLQGCFLAGSVVEDHRDFHPVRSSDLPHLVMVSEGKLAGSAATRSSATERSIARKAPVDESGGGLSPRPSRPAPSPPPSPLLPRSGPSCPGTLPILDGVVNPAVKKLVIPGTLQFQGLKSPLPSGQNQGPSSVASLLPLELKDPVHLRQGPTPLRPEPPPDRTGGLVR